MRKRQAQADYRRSQKLIPSENGVHDPTHLKSRNGIAGKGNIDHVDIRTLNRQEPTVRTSIVHNTTDHHRPPATIHTRDNSAFRFMDVNALNPSLEWRNERTLVPLPNPKRIRRQKQHHKNKMERLEGEAQRAFDTPAINWRRENPQLIETAEAGPYPWKSLDLAKAAANTRMEKIEPLWTEYEKAAVAHETNAGEYHTAVDKLEEARATLESVYKKPGSFKKMEKMDDYMNEMNIAHQNLAEAENQVDIKFRSWMETREEAVTAANEYDKVHDNSLFKYHPRDDEAGQKIHLMAHNNLWKFGEKNGMWKERITEGGVYERYYPNELGYQDVNGNPNRNHAIEWPDVTKLTGYKKRRPDQKREEKELWNFKP